MRLNAAWEAHQMPRKHKAPTVISLFAGCGGSSLGYSMAGFRELAAVEWDSKATETFRANFSTIPMFCEDIRHLNLDQMVVEDVDVLDGSPPCQGFSRVGRRKMRDSRNDLFQEFIRCLNRWHPKILIMENVPGLIQGKMKLMFRDILTQLKQAGYDVKAWVLNAAAFGVPQSRERVFFVGTRNELASIPTYPQPSHTIATTVRDAIQGTAIDDCGHISGRTAAMMRYVKQGSNLSKYTGRAYGFSWTRCAWNRPAPTLIKQLTYGGTSIFHPTENRNLSISELKRISSFPDAFRFDCSYRDAVAQMGNSVPPLFMKAIANHIRTEFLGK